MSRKLKVRPKNSKVDQRHPFPNVLYYNKVTFCSRALLQFKSTVYKQNNIEEALSDVNIHGMEFSLQ